ncbi:MAG: hypothetical protein IVW55_14185 [Chloroflexi bacterium]|nr:hypothetical protein [Chloroflexota bacterium]
MNDEQRRYLSYLLRLWQDRSPAVWRASLEDPQTRERLGFADIAQLFTFLEGQIAGGTPDGDHPMVDSNTATLSNEDGDSADHH